MQQTDITSLVVNDVSGLNPVPVWAIVAPTSVDALRDAVLRTRGALSIGGGRFSMGGQIASPDSLHIDMRRLNRVVNFSPSQKTVRVEAGIRWRDLQKFIDPHGLSVKLMQSYADFTVGGALSINAHGRYTGLGPVILSVRSIALLLADGTLIEATPTLNAELFYGAIGGYGGLGVIVEVELDLAENKRVRRDVEKLSASRYPDFFRKQVRNNSRVVFHNADLYPPAYSRARAISWTETDEEVTTRHRLVREGRAYSLAAYFIWSVTETPLGKWRKEFLIDPVIYSRKAVRWRNFEAGADVAELEPRSRALRTYVLQEYFVPIERYAEFLARMVEILRRHGVNVLNISIRHACADPGSILAWAREESFAFVLYYKQRTRSNAKERVAVWTRELIDAAIASGGTYYLPYQIHATAEQFHRAYPRAEEFFSLKRKYDPDFRWRNALWDTYYAPTLGNAPKPANTATDSDFHTIYDDVGRADAFYRFLQNIFHLYPEDRLHTLIKQACAEHGDDESIYRHVQRELPKIKPMLAPLTHAIPALVKQRREMAKQTLELLGGHRPIDGYLEIGSTGRYIGALSKCLALRGDLIVLNDIAPGYGPVDLIERAGIRQRARFAPLNNYEPIEPAAIADNSLDLVSCYIGLHHAPPERLPAFLQSLWRVLRPGGIFILRDHDVTSKQMQAFVSLAHTVFNAGLGVSWEENQRELRHFVSIAEWRKRLSDVGFIDKGKYLAQPNDPTDNLLLAFCKPGGAG